MADGRLQFRYESDRLISSLAPDITNGEWQHVKVSWMKGGHVWILINHGQFEFTGFFAGTADILNREVDRVVLGGTGESGHSNQYFNGCVKDLRIDGLPFSWSEKSVENNVARGCSSPSSCAQHKPCPTHAQCVDKWQGHECRCPPGTVGPRCEAVCDFEPCENNGRCEVAPDGYRCLCQSSDTSGEHCERNLTRVCPSHWWGSPICGPCSCDTDKGYDDGCDEHTGVCRCRSNHYQPDGKDGVCKPCDCYAIGSLSDECDLKTGQCSCRSGVIGQRCDSCANRLAEVTSTGCEVIYNGCPRSYSKGIWWDRTPFSEAAVVSCPTYSHGKASRVCHPEGGWQLPDLFNCTSDEFREMQTLSERLERRDLRLSTFTAIRTARELTMTLNQSQNELYGTDLLITAKLLNRVLAFELKQDLDLSHRQDRNFINVSFFVTCDRFIFSIELFLFDLESTGDFQRYC